ncbi:hypothetical protein [Fulvimarina sp. MAC8]|uniref:hypothetical protein n=1 Tax=Fulvimarina sp. MAC8 TaxID=3162874 RepID=UPI0032ED2D43
MDDRPSGNISTGPAIIKRHIMKTWIAVLAASLWILGADAANAAKGETLVEFFANQGCAVGPSTRLLARDAGFSDDAIEALLSKADGDDETVRTGGWIVLPPALCRIRPPEVRSEIRIDDPEVKALTTPMDVYSEFNETGCFLGGSPLMDRVQETRGWSAEKANSEYLRFIAENLRSGDLAFYSDDILRTPPNFQILTGDCADVPEIDDIRRSQKLRDQHFGPLIRADAPDADCGSGEGPSYHFLEQAKKRTNGKITNAWIGIEVQMMAIGGGWFEGTSVTQKGNPRPPICHFD